MEPNIKQPNAGLQHTTLRPQQEETEIPSTLILDFVEKLSKFYLF